MKVFYMDTNVFISRLKPDDPYHSETRAMIKSMEEGEIQAETSVFTLLEVASVSSRLYESRKTEGRRESEKERKVFIIRALRRIAGLKTRFIHIAGDTPLSVRGVQATIPSVFNEAILLSLQSNLRSLDLIHLAAARHAKRMNGELGAFVTGDEEFLADKKELAEIVGMPILSPREYVEALGLKREGSGTH